MKHSYAEFWAARGTTCFWVARECGYRVGAAFAWIAERMNLSPHGVSVLSFLAAAGGVILVAMAPINPVSGGLILFLALFGSYWLDCADGVLARVTGRTSSFGVVFDKVIDMLIATVTATALGVGALGKPSLLPQAWQPAILVLSVVPRSGFSVLSWLKDSCLHELSHTRSLAPRTSLFARAKILVGNLTDDVPWRLGLCISWATGFFWEFTLAFNSLLGAVFLFYLCSTRREMDTRDKLAEKEFKI